MSSLIGRKRSHPIVAPRAILRIRLVGGKAGRIPLDDLGELARGVQEAVLRIARSRTDRAGPGRTPADLRDWITLEATGIDPGSAVLSVEAPGLDKQQLPLDDIGDPVIEALSDLDDALDAISCGDALPPSIDQLSELTLRRMLRSLAGYERVEWSRETDGICRTIVLDPSAAEPEVDVPVPDDGNPEALVGRLYQLNLRSHGYGIEDDLGRSIHCDFPDDSEHLNEIRQLVGRRIVLTGIAFRDEKGDIAKFEVDEIQAADHDEQADEYFSFDLGAALATAQPVTDLSSLSISDLTQAEADDLWQALNN